MSSFRGFILQANYRVVTQTSGARVPVIHIYGRLENGDTFLIRDDRQRPQFYIRATDAERARALRSPTPLPIDKRAMDGGGVYCIQMDIPSDIPDLRDRLQANGIETFEADVRFAVRYLIERGVKGGCEVNADAVAGQNTKWIFNNPILRPADVKLTPRVLSFDIETDAKSERLLAISLFAPGVDEVLIVDSSARSMPEKATRCLNEYDALENFCQRIAQFDPDVITGWNIIDFDFSVLERIAKRVRHPFEFGRDAGAIRIRKAEGYFGSGQATIPGRLVLDGIDLLRGAFVKMDDYSLDAVA
ncbi:MAG TPA: 3'-5' exonuclease, partial [Steroidobacteraceae bacterium]|nr:3'-5' exonuclease [Steroidobacteraceae bacterium]